MKFEKWCTMVTKGNKITPVGLPILKADIKKLVEPWWWAGSQRNLMWEKDHTFDVFCVINKLFKESNRVAAIAAKVAQWANILIENTLLWAAVGMSPYLMEGLKFAWKGVPICILEQSLFEENVCTLSHLSCNFWHSIAFFNSLLITWNTLKGCKFSHTLCLLLTAFHQGLTNFFISSFIIGSPMGVLGSFCYIGTLFLKGYHWLDVLFFIN